MPTSSAASALVYIYDGLDRLTKKNVSFSTLHDLYEEYSYYGYTSGGVQYTTPLVSSLTLKKDSTTTATYSYTYDSLGNILTVSKDDSLIYAYEYDSLNQLTREDDVAQGTSTLFDYDLSGNITARHIFPYWAGCPTSQLRTLIGIDQYCTTVSYGYSAGTWGDMLTSYNGTTITYDAIGNPTKWRNALGLTWSGKKLTYIAIDGLDEGLGASYNADGIRTKKTYWDENANQTFHEYVLDGSKIVKETVSGSSSHTLYYYYDESGVAGFELNGVTYYYLKNIQGDVINILNSSGQIVVTYTYDAWGKVLSVTGSLAGTVGYINPFRYRGYYYDRETGFYYLQTRYYDPEVGRFLNADGIIGANGGIPGFNLFAYCNNNPVMYSDPLGLCPHDGKLYKDSPYKGLPEYNPYCEKCQAHGSYSLGDTEFYNVYYRTQLIDFIAGCERFSGTRTSNNCIGYGTSISDNQEECYYVLGTYTPSSITVEQARMLVDRIIMKHEKTLFNDDYSYAISLSLNQRYAILSFSYNRGNHLDIKNAMMNKGDTLIAWGTCMIREKLDDGSKVVREALVKRRIAEYNIYTFGIYRNWWEYEIPERLRSWF